MRLAHRRFAASIAAVLALGLAPALPSSGAAAAERDLPAPPPPTELPTAAEISRDLDRALLKIRRAGAVGVTARVDNSYGTWQGAAGLAQLDPARPARADSRFRAASVTKMLTAVLALGMVERGRWTLETTIGDVLPKLWPARSDVTLRQLLSHSSGMPDMLAPLIAEAKGMKAFERAVSKRRTDRELVAVAKAQEWLFEPGTSMTYSNTGFVVVGMMLKKATGQSMPALMRSRVLRPARMTQSTFATTRGMRGPRLREYAAFGKRKLDLGRFHPTMFSSAGALVTTARDLNRFQLALSKGRLLEPRQVTAMRRVVASSEELGLEYGLGSYRLPNPCREGGFVFGHDGGSWGTVTMSFSSSTGGKRVTVAMTGRDLTGRPATVRAIGQFVYTALGATCLGGPAGATQRPFDAPDLKVLPPLAH